MRLFVAVELDERVRSVMVDAQKKLGRACDGVRWIRPEQLHMTVKFLGEVEDGRIAEICESAKMAAAECRCLDLRVSACGCFPPRGAVRIVWVGVGGDEGGITPMVQGVESRFESIGFPRETKPFSPHITIGRVRDDRSQGGIRSAAAAHSPEPAVQRVDSLVVMSSVLSRSGSTYTVVSRSRLGSET